MKHTMKTLDESLRLLLPSIAEAMDKGIRFTRPTLLTMIAEQHFVKTFDREFDPSYEERMACYVCQEAMIDLKEYGEFRFGDKEFRFS